MPAVGNDCLVDAETGELMPAVTSTLSLARPTALAGLFEARCDQTGLAELVIEIQPRQTLNVQLLISHSRAESARLTLAGEYLAADWLEIDPEPHRLADLSAHNLVITAGAELSAGDRRELLLAVSLDDDQDWRQIPITLIVQQEAPLFRDRFEVDPVLGQFSYRLPPLLPASESARLETRVLAALAD